MRSAARQKVSKVPELTLRFWVLEIAATTLRRIDSAAAYFLHGAWRRGAAD